MNYSYVLDADGFDPYSNFLKYVNAYDADACDPLMDDIAADFENDPLSEEYEIDWDGEFTRDEIEREGVMLYIPLKLK
jgi:hypothetical protein